MTYAYLSGRDLGIEEHIAVLHCAGKNVWEERHLSPALEFTLPDGSSFDRMFRSFIFMCVKLDGTSMHPLADPFGQIPDMSTWQHWLDELFAKRRNLDALSRAAGSPVDVWVSLPYPRRGQLDFGELSGKKLKFADDDDRLNALTWWIDSFLLRWNEAVKLHDKLIFRGFVWLREDILPEEDVELASRVNERIHERNLLSLWLPNYGSNQFYEWKKIGFDVAALNSNFYGAGPYGREWLEWTSMSARTYNMGMQIPCGCGLLYNDNNLIDHFNLGLPNHYDYIQGALVVYRFMNQSIHDMYAKDFASYRRLYMFLTGIYRKTYYPDMDY